MTNITDTRIALVGYGNIARSLLTGLLATTPEATRISVSNPTADKFTELNQKNNRLRTYTSNVQAVENATLVILCVKPNMIQTVCAEIKHLLIKQTTILISVAAGVSVDLLQQWTSEALPIIRCMPNTPSAVGCGITALYANQCADTEHKKITADIFATVGATVWLNDEQDMHVVTALSGSGPAYFFRFTEALAKAAQHSGCSTEIAQRLALQTLYGAANLAVQSDSSLATLREQITSKGGVTEQGLKALEQVDIDQIAHTVLTKASARSIEISQQLEDK
ncbi:MAG: pyrroline-5-carboxylate reductase [Chromatiales bacterium]|nr:pyrroline-5-carboxylate reductase [Chromatiales bacterium]